MVGMQLIVCANDDAAMWRDQQAGSRQNLAAVPANRLAAEGLLAAVGAELALVEAARQDLQPLASEGPSGWVPHSLNEGLQEQFLRPSGRSAR